MGGEFANSLFLHMRNNPLFTRAIITFSSDSLSLAIYFSLRRYTYIRYVTIEVIHYRNNVSIYCLYLGFSSLSINDLIAYVNNHR